MGQSLVKNYIHVIFSTKQRIPLIHQPVEEELYCCMYRIEIYSAFQGLNFSMIFFTGLRPVLMYFALSELGL